MHKIQCVENLDCFSEAPNIGSVRLKPKWCALFSKGLAHTKYSNILCWKHFEWASTYMFTFTWCIFQKAHQYSCVFSIKNKYWLDAWHIFTCYQVNDAIVDCYPFAHQLKCHTAHSLIWIESLIGANAVFHTSLLRRFFLNVAARV